MSTQIATKRVCRHEGCKTFLRSTNPDDYCSVHIDPRTEIPEPQPDESPYMARYTKEQMIDAIKGYYKDHGRVPRGIDMRYPLPARTTCAAAFGSWRAALAAAGFVPMRTGPNRLKPPNNDSPRGRVVGILGNASPLTLSELRDATGLTYRSVEGVIRRLYENGMVQRHLVEPRGYPYKGSGIAWSLTERDT